MSHGNRHVISKFFDSIILYCSNPYIFATDGVDLDI